MTFSAEEATELVATAFPWGAFVDLGEDNQFVSLRYGVDQLLDGETVLLRFERDPGDTLQRATRDQLRAATVTGTLSLGHATVRQPEPGDLVLLADPLRDFVGPQSDSDDRWTRRMRLHQSWWRTFRLRVPFGSGRGAGSDHGYGNMLDGADATANFLSDDAHRAYIERIELSPTGVDRWRTSRNLLASQPMAFNLFGHLRFNLELATRLFRPLVGDELAKVTGVEIERLSTALGDRTAFDAFITYERHDRSSGCIAVETKLTEPFSQQSYDWSRYLVHAAFDSAVWTTADPKVLGDLRWSQLWRNHLLARAEASRDVLGDPLVLIVHHPEDPHCTSIISSYRQLLTDPESVRAVDLGVIVEHLRQLTIGDPVHEGWVNDLHDRYLDLNLSEPLLPWAKEGGRR